MSPPTDTTQTRHRHTQNTMATPVLKAEAASKRNHNMQSLMRVMRWKLGLPNSNVNDASGKSIADDSGLAVLEASSADMRGVDSPLGEEEPIMFDSFNRCGPGGSDMSWFASGAASGAEGAAATGVGAHGVEEDGLEFL